MNKRLNLIMAGGYVAVGLLAIVVLSAISGEFMIGLLIGLVIIMLGGLSHEFLLRSETHQRTARALVGLRDKVETKISGMEKDVGKAKADAQGANATAQQVQAAAQTATEQLKALQDDYGATREFIPQLQQFQQSVSGDVEYAKQTGEQLRAELQALQQQQATLQQQIQQVQSMIAAAAQPAPAAPAVADNPPPPQPAAAPEPQPAPPPPPRAAPEPAAPQPEAAPPPAAAAEGLTAAALATLEQQIGAADSDSLVDNSLRAIAESLQADAVDLYAEPIVTLPERTPVHVECYGGVRAADGSALTIDQNLDLSGREPVMMAIENALLARCLDRIVELDAPGGDESACFYNVSGMTLADRGFFSTLIQHLEANPGLAGKLVLEFPQAALMEHGEQAVEDLVRLQETGCRFSIDEITDLEIDFESLVGFGFRFIKVGSKFIRVQANQADDPETVRGLAASLKGIGIDVVVENVETDLSLVELIGFDIGLGQGPLFGQPSLVRS